MLVHLRGHLVAHDQAAVSPFDRGFIFGDALYEGLRAFADPRLGGRPRVVALGRHVARLAEGLRQVGIDWDARALGPLTAELLAANRLTDAFVYWQVTRGTPDLRAGPARTRVPASGQVPTVFGYCTPLPPLNLVSPQVARKRAATQPDLRWLRGSLKSTSLLGNVLPASTAHAQHAADEALLIRDTPAGPLLTEGTYTNVVLALPAREGRGPVPGLDLVTPSLGSASILDGVTRQVLLDLEPGLRTGVVPASDLHRASEVLLIGTTTMVSCVTHLDGRALGTSHPGPAARHLLRVLSEGIAAGLDEPREGDRTSPSSQARTAHPAA